MPDPLVSISCPVYNHESFLRQCLDGFVMQRTDFPFEAIVHDDASTDGSAAIIREYAEKYPEIIKPIYETENQYSKRDGSLRRIINAAVRGKYFAMCEGDDYWTDPLKLQKQVDLLEADPSIGLVYTDFDLLDESSGDLKPSAFTNGWMPHLQDDTDFFIRQGFRAPLTWLMRTELATGPLPLEGSVDDSYPQMLEVILSPKKIYYFPESTAVYRVLRGSISHCTDLLSYYKRTKGLWEIQKLYIDQFDLDADKKYSLARSNYKALSIPALLIKDEEMIHEIGEWIKEHGIRKELAGWRELKRALLVYKGIPLSWMRWYIKMRKYDRKVMANLY